MRRAYRTVWLAASILAVTACGQSGTSTSQGGSVALAGGPAKTDKAADEAALRAIYQKMPGQLMSADTAAFGALFADDGVEIMPGMPPAKGREAVKKELVSVVTSMKDLKLEMVGDADITVADAGDLAVVKAPYRMSYLDAKRKPIEDHGTSLTVFKKVDGKWKILIDTNISEVPPQ